MEKLFIEYVIGVKDVPLVLKAAPVVTQSSSVSRDFIVDTLYEYLTSDHGKDELSLYLSEQTRSYIKVTDVEDDCEQIALMVHDYQAVQYLKFLSDSDMLSSRINDFLNKTVWEEDTKPEINVTVEKSSTEAIKKHASGKFR